MKTVIVILLGLGLVFVAAVVLLIVCAFITPFWSAAVDFAYELGDDIVDWIRDHFRR